MGISSANSGDIAVVLENDHGAAGFLPPHLWLLRQGKSAVINELNVPEHISRASISPFSPPYPSSRNKSQHLQKHCDEGTVVCRQDDSKEGGWRWEPQGPSPLGALDLALLSRCPAWVWGLRSHAEWPGSAGRRAPLLPHPSRSLSLRTVQPEDPSCSGSRDVPPALFTQVWGGEYTRHHSWLYFYLIFISTEIQWINLGLFSLSSSLIQLCIGLCVLISGHFAQIAYSRLLSEYPVLDSRSLLNISTDMLIPKC